LLYDKTFIALKPQLVPASEFQVSSVKFLLGGLIIFSWQPITPFALGRVVRSYLFNISIKCIL